MRRIDYRLPLGLMMRPAPRILRELPPSLAAYRVQVFFQAAPSAAPAIAWSAGARGETKNPSLLHPVETPSQGQMHETRVDVLSTATAQLWSRHRASVKRSRRKTCARPQADRQSCLSFRRTESLAKYQQIHLRAN